MAWYRTGPWFNIKISSYQYRKPHCGDKTILRPSYLHNGISYTGKTTSLYWIGAQGTSHCIIWISNGRVYWRILWSNGYMTPHIFVNIGLGNVVPPVRYQVMTWTNCDLYDLIHMNKLRWNFDKNTAIYIQENEFENVVCKMTSISSQLQTSGTSSIFVKWLYRIKTMIYPLDRLKSRAMRLSNSLYRPISKRTSQLRITGPLWGESIADRFHVTTSSYELG